MMVRIPLSIVLDRRSKKLNLATYLRALGYMSDDEIRTRLKDSALKWIEFFLNDAGFDNKKAIWCHKILFLTLITCAVIILLQHRPFQS